MYKKNKSEVPIKTLPGLVSHLLLLKSQVSETHLSVTWVDVAPGASQVLHQHAPEQVYVIIQGKGVMTVGSEKQVVSVGDIVYVPSNYMHGIENKEATPLSYISAATPAFDDVDINAFYKKA